ncbi:TPA: lpg0172 family Dot/Icm T4SS effector [Legionella pneumophila]|uniref:Lpg0172 family Dot/Icm T4SS effector n=1 Tax=Legionella pneumophila TaxID=446 RepID=A0AAN5TBC3_LEGPN|nr:lpg0172 family Dot/Icm T4SS effector [Legionella pneumophila]MDW9158932.1 lpg0172 family Dot/Icm T4SS effector [Legionella pneumophila]TIH00886.1 hypothetical protein DI137_13660 [Legionella pneumophila]WAI74806.1 lpg0172 family Dot/Icm T4SS effector [Legionella pneumophila]HAT1775279.1 lpg0172 family Dot/Icm T4SS effector [Legionella pneumophila]HAT1778792.1 lpg0172 family Dot/Icm T4SS effector [Legionella pneumophila]
MLYNKWGYLMTTLYIKNLRYNEVAVCRALFEAAEKTEEGIKTKRYGMQMTADMPGLWSPLSNYDIENDLRMARVHRNGRMREIGYLTVNLVFQFDSLDVTEYETKYGISAKDVLEKAGFTCSQDAAGYSEPASTSTRLLGQESKPEKPTQTSVVNTSFFALKSVDTDKRFTKSTKPGILYEARSYGKIEDDTLKSYGFTDGQWERQKEGIENIVIIKKLTQSISPRPAILGEAVDNIPTLS